MTELSSSSLSYRRENTTKKNEQSLKDQWGSITPTYTLGEFQKGEEGEKGLERIIEETGQKTSHSC